MHMHIIGKYSFAFGARDNSKTPSRVLVSDYSTVQHFFRHAKDVGLINADAIGLLFRGQGSGDLGVVKGNADGGGAVSAELLQGFRHEILVIRDDEVG